MKTRKNTHHPADFPTANLVVTALSPATERLVARALKAMEKEAIYRPDAMLSPSNARHYLTLKLAALEREELHALWLDAQNRLIAFECLAIGTVTESKVYQREVVRAALAHNASGVIFAHNHPSGASSPSAADKMLTDELKNALDLVDVKVLDHFIVAGADSPLSMAEKGLL